MNPQTDEHEYDHSIHTNHDARAWANFWLETWLKMRRDGNDPFTNPSEAQEWMQTWFANAMMAMHDHLTVRPLSTYFKVPGRDVYCATRWQWLTSLLRCYIWLPVKLAFRPLPTITG